MLPSQEAGTYDLSLVMPSRNGWALPEMSWALLRATIIWSPVTVTSRRCPIKCFSARYPCS
eukprot:3040068-Ditylum_brightwellii.AAC.1